MHPENDFMVEQTHDVVAWLQVCEPRVCYLSTLDRLRQDRGVSRTNGV